MARRIAMPGDSSLDRVGRTWGNIAEMRRIDEVRRTTERIGDALTAGFASGEAAGEEKGKEAGIIIAERRALNAEIAILRQIVDGKLDATDVLRAKEAERDAKQDRNTEVTTAESVTEVDYDIPRFAGDKALASLEFVGYQPG